MEGIIMKTLRPMFLACALALSAGISCDSTSTSVSNNGNNNGNNNGSNNTANNAAIACTQGTECPSGVCAAGICKVVGSNNSSTCENGGTASVCGNCDPTCQKSGSGGTDPFILSGDPDDNQTSQGVVLDPEGAVTIDVKRVESQFIWIANTGEGTVSKIDTRTFEEVGRYLTGPAGAGNDPSRTSVNTFGDVFVGNRSGMTVTKISALGEDCADKDGDNVVTTSTGAADIKPWGTDDCVLWTTSLPNGGIIRAVAAQDARANGDAAADIKPAVWVGGWNGRIWKLDSDNGSILVDTESPNPTYGFALDGAGNLWISSLSATLGRLDTNRCVDNASCSEAVCDGEGAGDACVKQRINVDHTSYGITVDFKQRVWMGGSRVLRYDHKAAAGARQTYVDQLSFVHGIAADDKGWIWGAGYGSGVYRINADNPTENIAVPGTQFSSKGVAIDLDGKVWSINQGESTATVIVPGAGVNDNQVTTPVTGLVSPYTYSDMTGAQLRFVSNERGYYRRIFEGCPDATGGLETDWQEIRWDVETPGDSKVNFRARGANSRAELTNAQFIDLASVPPDTSPFDMSVALQAAGLQGMKFIEVEAALTAVRDATNSVFAPKLKSMEITYSCPIIIQ
jgi:sugar lactone lactonase YvrE